MYLRLVIVVVDGCRCLVGVLGGICCRGWERTARAAYMVVRFVRPLIVSVVTMAGSMRLQQYNCGPSLGRLG
jgi:hypothetical protein